MYGSLPLQGISALEVESTCVYLGQCSGFGRTTRHRRRRRRHRRRRRRGRCRSQREGDDAEEEEDGSRRRKADLNCY